MRTREDLLRMLQRLDGKGYKAYRDLRGPWDLGACRFVVDHVQGDPFAAPSRVRLQVAPEAAALRPQWYESRIRAVALRDFLARRLDEACRRVARGRRGTGHSGEVRVDAPGQEVLASSAVVLTEGGGVEARLTVGLPARGRRIAGREAAAMLTEELPSIAALSLRAEALDAEAVWRHVTAVEDAAWLRSRLREMDLVSFLADGSVLPRRSGAGVVRPAYFSGPPWSNSSCRSFRVEADRGPGLRLPFCSSPVPGTIAYLLRRVPDSARLAPSGCPSDD